MRFLILLTAITALAACQPVIEPQATVTQAAPVAVGTALLARSGVIVEDAHDSLLTFGTPLETVEARLTPILGPVLSRTTNTECGAGTLNFIRFGGITLMGSNGDLVGWTAEGDSLRTDAGIHIGSPESALSTAYTTQISDSTLGREFDAEGFYGLITSGTISDLWAGTSCAFR